MKHKQNTLLTFFIVISSLSFAQGPFNELKDIAGFKQKFSQVTRNTQTIEASFVQEKNLSVLSEKIITKGKFLFKKENKLRWEYTNPFRYLIILNNGTIFTQDEENKNKIDIRNNKMFTEINLIIMGCVQGTLFNDEKKFVSTYFENNRYYLIKLKPVESTLKEYISEIKLSFDKNDLSVTRFEMNEPSGDYTIIEFTGKKLNTIIPDEKFLVP
jgi:outer membrane lipoprotein-sorting protein